MKKKNHSTKESSMRIKFSLLIISLIVFFGCNTNQNSIIDLFKNKSFVCQIEKVDSKHGHIGFQKEHENLVQSYELMLISNFNLKFTSNQFELSNERFNFKGNWYVENDSTISLGDSYLKIKMEYLYKTNDEIFLKGNEAFVINDIEKDDIEIFKGRGINLNLKEIK